MCYIKIIVLYVVKNVTNQLQECGSLLSLFYRKQTNNKNVRFAYLSKDGVVADELN